jgi:hypothetical protein
MLHTDPVIGMQRRSRAPLLIVTSRHPKLNPMQQSASVLHV